MWRQLSGRRILVDGTVLSVIVTVIVFASIYANPLIFIDSYPPDVRAAAGEADVPALQIWVPNALCLAAVFGVALWSNSRLRRRNGGHLRFWTSFAHSALLFLFFALWDLVICDWLIFVTIRPDFIVVPGTEGLAGYSDYWFHFEVSFLGAELWFSTIAGGLVVAGLSMIRPGGGRRPAGDGGTD